MIWAHLPPSVRRMWAGEADFQETARALARRDAAGSAPHRADCGTADGGQGQRFSHTQDEVRS